MVSVCPDSAFGNYSYPVKIYEALACNALIVASETRSIADILQQDGQSLFPVGDAVALAGKIEMALSSNNANARIMQDRWEKVALKLQDCLINAH
jgi:glycosyltransferase involved in cell wall biosynthesis